MDTSDEAEVTPSADPLSVQSLAEELRKSKKMFLHEHQTLSSTCTEIKEEFEHMLSKSEEKENQIKNIKDQVTKDQARIMSEIQNLSSAMKEKMESIDVKPPSVVSRTVSLGPDTGDVKKIKTELTNLEKHIIEVKDQLHPILAEFRTGNLMSPAMAALHEQLIQVKGEGEHFRKELDMSKNKADQLQHENKIRIRSFHEELERIKVDLTKKVEETSNIGDIDVIVSIDGQTHPSGTKSLERTSARKSVRGLDYRKDLKQLEAQVC